MTIDPTTTALLIMDYQMGIVGRFAADADGLVARVAAARALVRQAGGRIGYVRVAFEPSEYASVAPENKTFAGHAPGAMDTGAPGTQIFPDLAPAADDIVVRKTRVGAFSTTTLDLQLRARGIRSLILAGISTSGVVLSTVRDAADRDYQLVVLADCCADQPEIHQFLTSQIFPRQAAVITSDVLPQLFSHIAQQGA